MVGASLSEASRAKKVLSKKRLHSPISSRDGTKNGDTESKRRSMMLMDVDIIDCPICFEALKIPIFECANGHLVCFTCCSKLSNKCYACALPISSRCRAMESVLESVFAACTNAKLGCTKYISYGKESIHEKKCTFSPCFCPTPGCNYSSLYKDLYCHYTWEVGEFLISSLQK